MASWSNKHNIDPVIAEAIMNEDYVGGGDISATGLIKPPQIAMLEAKHDHEIVKDVSDYLWVLLGRSIHYVLNQGAAEATSSEQRLTAEIDGWTVSGQFDVYYQGDGPGDAVLKDFKVTSVWAYIYGGKKDWEAQLNIYGWLSRKNGTPVDKLVVAAILRDWNRHQSKQHDYPNIPFVEIPYRLWSMEETERYILGRIADHKLAREGTARDCTPEERWAQPEKYAVKKPTAKRAFRNFPSRFKAQQFLDKMSPVKAGEYKIFHTRGKQIRCESYCDVVQWCPQAKALGVGEDED